MTFIRHRCQLLLQDLHIRIFITLRCLICQISSLHHSFGISFTLSSFFSLSLNRACYDIIYCLSSGLRSNFCTTFNHFIEFLLFFIFNYLIYCLSYVRFSYLNIWISLFYNRFLRFRLRFFSFWFFNEFFSLITFFYFLSLPFT